MRIYDDFVLARAFDLALTETVLGGHENIRREHVLIGICSLEKFVAAAPLAIYHPDLVNRLVTEVQIIERGLAQFEASPTDLRRHVRTAMARGDYSHSARAVIHRSPECKAAFLQARKLAEEAGAPTLRCIHLLAAILGDVGPLLAEALDELGIEGGHLSRLLLAPDDGGAATHQFGE